MLFNDVNFEIKLLKTLQWNFITQGYIFQLLGKPKKNVYVTVGYN